MKKVSIFVLVILAALAVFSANASAVALPYLGSGGNYTYTEGAGTGSLIFTNTDATWVTYENGSGWDDLPPYSDDISSASEFIFGPLLNTSGDPTNFGSSTLTVRNKYTTSDIYFTATIDNFDATATSAAGTWMSLSNVTAGNLSSRFVTELLAVGNGLGNLQVVTFTPGGGGDEDFVGSSSGSTGFIVAAPEPVSSVLFIVGSATLAFIRYRKKRA